MLKKLFIIFIILLIIFSGIIACKQTQGPMLASPSEPAPVKVTQPRPELQQRQEEKESSVLPQQGGGGLTVEKGQDKSGSGTTGLANPKYEGFSFNLTTGTYWEFFWEYKYNTWAQASSSKTTYDGGNFRITLGKPSNIQGIRAYEVTVSGDSEDNGGHNYAPPWKWLAIHNYQILGSADGSTLQVIFDAHLDKLQGGGFFTTRPPTASAQVSESMIDNKYIRTSAISLSTVLSQTKCEIIEGRKICPNETSYTLSEREFFKGGMGPLGYDFFFNRSSSGGGFSSGVSYERHLGLVTTSQTAKDGFEPRMYPWRDVTVIPDENIFGIAAVALNNKIYIIGGQPTRTSGQDS